MSLAETLHTIDQGRHNKPTKPINLDVLKSARILTLDIESLPSVVHVWQLKQTGYIPHKNILSTGGMLGFAYKWLHENGEDATRWVDYRDGNQHMLDTAWGLLDEASYVVTYNGDKYDLPKLQGHFARAGMGAPAKAKSIDLVKTSRSMFWESASLDFSCRQMGVRRKVDNGGASNWEGCLDGDTEAWRRMEEYCKGDVLATEELYLAYLPWLKNAPSMGFTAGKDGEVCCPRCGHCDVESVGVYQAVTIRYDQYRCRNCRGVFRGRQRSRIVQTVAL